MPALPSAWRAVTLGQALHHTSGLPDYTTSAGFQADLQANLLRRFTPLELIAYVEGEPLRFRPDSAYNYANTDNVVVALMAEAVTGRSYERLLGSQVYRPLGVVGDEPSGGAQLPRAFAHGYVLDPPQPPEDVSEAISMSGVWASGEWCRRRAS